MTIAVIESQEEIDKFSEILGQEAKKMMKASPEGSLNLKDKPTYDVLMDRVKVRFRAWQMEKPGFEESSSAKQYQREAVVQGCYDDIRRRER